MIRAILERPVDQRWLTATLASWLGTDLVLLWHFLGRATAGSDAIGLMIVITIVVMIVRTTPGGGVSFGTVLLSLAIAAILLALGGEGRLAYATRDWMVRDAVLRDMALHGWPFAYTARGVAEILRCPLGMYLVPALVMKAAGQAAGDIALLIQNTVLLAIVFALGSRLFDTARTRGIAICTFVMFSGLDAIGASLAGNSRPLVFADHLEWWAAPLQYSSQITQLFWVPQHALAGWICAIGYLSWHDRRLPLGVFLGLVPLTILWSPLAAVGALPFAAIAMVQTMRRRTLLLSDIITPGLATVLAVPALAYLGASGATVGANVTSVKIANYVTFELLEVLPFVVPLALGASVNRFGRISFCVVVVMLVLLPFAQVGWSSDLMMRSSIPALAILAVMTAHAVTTDSRHDMRVLLVIALLIGSLTGLHEIVRALTWPVSPPPRCTFFRAWGPSPPGHKSTYLAPVAALPPFVRAARYSLVSRAEPARCWARPWPQPRGI